MNPNVILLLDSKTIKRILTKCTGGLKPTASCCPTQNLLWFRSEIIGKEGIRPGVVWALLREGGSEYCWRRSCRCGPCRDRKRSAYRAAVRWHRLPGVAIRVRR